MAEPGARLGQPRIHCRQIDSTNALARELAAAGAPHGTLVTADRQLAGRGRQGRTWADQAGGSLLCSWVIREPSPLLSLRAGVAVAEVCGEQAQIKWPNDVLIDGRKVAGILVEGRPQARWAVLGIGLNVAVSVEDLPEIVRDRAGTLGLAPKDMEMVLAALGESLWRWLIAADAEILAALGARDALAGQTVTWSDGSGMAGGVDQQGRLRVMLSTGVEVLLDAGEVHLSRS